MTPPATIDAPPVESGPRPRVEQNPEQLECLGREVDFFAAPQELPRVEVKGQLAKPESHSPR